MPTAPASRLSITLLESARTTSAGHRLAVGGSIVGQVGAFCGLVVLAASIQAAIPKNPEVDENPSFLAPFRQQVPRPMEERLSFAALGGEVAPMVETRPATEAPRPIQAPVPEASGGDGEVASEAVEEEPQKTFSDIEVDSAVVRDSTSAGPDYPPELMAKGIEGSVLASFIVDTTGLPDLSTFIALEATHPEFATAVRAALPK